MTTLHKPVGDHLREWRMRRRMSQMDLALDAEISTRRLSFLETGRARPSREMVLLLAEQLEVPLRDRNVILVAAGFAPVFAERSLDDPGMAAARRAVDVILAAHEPYPALVVDLRWNLVAANAAVAPMLEGVDPALLAAPLNVIRLSLHPRGLASRIANLGEWHAHILERLRRQAELTADPGLIALIEEIRGYPAGPRPPSRGLRRCRDPVPADGRRPNAVAVRDHDGFRHARRYHPVGTHPGNLLPRRPRHRRSPPRGARGATGGGKELRRRSHMNHGFSRMARCRPRRPSLSAGNP